MKAYIPQSMAFLLVATTCLELTAALSTKQVLQTHLVNEWMLMSQSSTLDWAIILQAKTVSPSCYTQGTAFTGGLTPCGQRSHGVLTLESNQSWSEELRLGQPFPTPCLFPSFLLRFLPSNPDQSRSPEGHLGLTLFAPNLKWLSSAAAKGNTVRSFIQVAHLFWTKLRGMFFSIYTQNPMWVKVRARDLKAKTITVTATR